MHKTGWYIDLRIVFTHSFEHEIPNLVFNLVSLEKKFGAIVSWVLNHSPCSRIEDSQLVRQVVLPDPFARRSGPEFGRKHISRFTEGFLEG